MDQVINNSPAFNQRNYSSSPSNDINFPSSGSDPNNTTFGCYSVDSNVGHQFRRNNLSSRSDIDRRKCVVTALKLPAESLTSITGARDIEADKAVRSHYCIANKLKDQSKPLLQNIQRIRIDLREYCIQYNLNMNICPRRSYKRFQVMTQWLMPFIFILWYFIGPVSGSECLSCIGMPCQKVTGLFMKKNLSPGYNVIATIPSRACNLTVQELKDSNNFLGKTRNS